MQSVTASLRVLTTNNSVDKLRHDRKDLKRRIRGLVDTYAPEAMVGWWRNAKEAKAKVHVSESMIADAEASMQSISIALAKGKRHADERAVLTVAQRAENRTAMLWLAGRNDSFYHVHLLPRFLDAGVDIFALDLRRCGRARFDIMGNETTNALLAHDSFDFNEYYEEIDSAVHVILGRDVPHAQPPLLDKKQYDSIVMYGHSTGGLIGAMFAADSKLSEHISGCGIRRLPFP